jgi:RecA/RadA recombinase
LALQIGGQIQQVGGVVGLAESEEALTLDFAKRMAGIDVDQVINIDVDSLEQMFKEGEDFVRRVQAKAKANKIKPPIVGWLTDSLAGYPTQAELETPVDQSTATAIAARKIRLSFRKLTKLFAGERVVMVFTNHQTANIASGPFGGRKWTTYGGSGPRFWASVRLKLDVIGQLKSKNRQTGVWVRATIIKNRQDPPGMKIDYPIRWGTGIDNVWATIRWLKDQKRLGTTSGKVSWDGKSMNEVDLVKAAYRDPVLRAALEEEMRAMFKVLRDAMMADGSSDPEELEDEVEGYGDDDAEAGDGDVEGEA